MNLEELVTLASVSFPEEVIGKQSPFLPFAISLAVLTLICVCLGEVVEHTALFTTKQVAGTPQRGAVRSTTAKVLACFSISKNLEKFFKAPVNHIGDFKIFHGIKVIAMISVALVHYNFIMMGLPAYNVNPKTMRQMSDTYLWTLEFSAMYAIDIFFFISSFM